MSTNSSLSSLASLDDLLRIFRDKLSILGSNPDYQHMLQNEFWRARSKIDLTSITADILTSPFLIQQAISSALQAVQTAMLDDPHINMRDPKTAQLVYGLYTADTSKLLESFANMSIHSAELSTSAITRQSLPVKKASGLRTTATKQRQEYIRKNSKAPALTESQQMQLISELKTMYEDDNFQYYPFGQRRCLKQGCELCRKVFCYAPLSNCSLHGGPKCTHIGWYPHLPPQVQAYKVKEHRQGTVSIWQPPLQPGQIQNPLPELLFPHSSGAHTPPPYQPRTPDGTPPPPSDEAMELPLRPVVRAPKRTNPNGSCSTSWADEVEQIDGAKAPRIEATASISGLE